MAEKRALGVPTGVLAAHDDHGKQQRHDGEGGDQRDVQGRGELKGSSRLRGSGPARSAEASEAPRYTARAGVAAAVHAMSELNEVLARF